MLNRNFSKFIATWSMCNKHYYLSPIKTRGCSSYEMPCPVYPLRHIISRLTTTYEKNKKVEPNVSLRNQIKLWLTIGWIKCSDFVLNSTGEPKNLSREKS